MQGALVAMYTFSLCRNKALNTEIIVVNLSVDHE